jgi:aspartyl-tRNA(Asn)/glutamyl-tRNA(Gln) amidotransferase subunit B
MSNVATRAKYKPTIGIECHVQLKTKTKLFAGVANDAREAAPNTLISHICVGLPGALPVLNQVAVDLACRAAFALGTTPQKFSHFDRKHYFYPDLPKGYQITQYAQPIIADGHVHINLDGKSKCIRIIRAHLEEDAGKNIHPAGADYSLVDLNRAGTPLLEIVSAPDLHSPAEAKAFARELYLLMKYAGVSDVDLYHGNMRFDVNTSVSQTDEPGIRTEVKNLNSFRSVEAAVEYEINRQIEILEKGEKIIQETRGWDEAKQKTVSQRGKEEAEDYRYFPEPDVPPTELDEAYINKIANDLPVLPPAIRMELAQLKLEPQVIEDLLETAELTKLLEILNQSGPGIGRRAAFWLLETGQLDITRDSQLAEMVEASHISTSAAKAVRAEMAKSDESPEQIAERLNLLQVSDEAEIETIVKKVLADNTKAAEDVKSGEAKAIGFLVGQVMRESKGKANPGLAQQAIKKQLGIN